MYLEINIKLILKAFNCPLQTVGNRKNKLYIIFRPIKVHTVVSSIVNIYLLCMISRAVKNQGS